MKKILYLLVLLTIAVTSCKKFTYSNRIEKTWQRVDKWGNNQTWQFKDGFVIKAFTTDTLFTYDLLDKNTIMFKGIGYEYTDISVLHKLSKDSLIIQFEQAPEPTIWIKTGEK